MLYTYLASCERTRTIRRAVITNRTTHELYRDRGAISNVLNRPQTSSVAFVNQSLKFTGMVHLHYFRKTFRIPLDFKTFISKIVDSESSYKSMKFTNHFRFPHVQKLLFHTFHFILNCLDCTSGPRLRRIRITIVNNDFKIVMMIVVVGFNVFCFHHHFDIFLS